MKNYSSLFLSSCKRPLDTLSDLHVGCMYYATQSLRGTFSDGLALVVLSDKENVCNELSWNK